MERKTGRARRALRALAVGALSAWLALSPASPAIEAALAAQPGGTGRVVTQPTTIRYGGGADTGRFTVDGAAAWCSDPQFTSPKTGDYPVAEAHTRPNKEGWSHKDSTLRSVVYRSYGAPGFDRSEWPSTDWDGSAVTDDELYAYSHIMIADRMWAQGDIALRATKPAFKRWYCHEFLGYEWGTPGTPITNPDAVALRFEREGSPEGFRVIELDTGYNSKYVPGGRSQTIISFIPEVDVRFTKCSADASLTAENPEYSVAGAEYDIFSASDGAKVSHIVMDGSGHADLRLQPNKRYYAVETRAPKGYRLKADRVEFTTGNSSSEERLVDDPGSLYFKVQKKDSSTHGEAQPGASLEGAEYKLVDANGKAHIAKTDKDGFIVFGDPAIDGAIPFGKVTVTETKAPKGYKLDPTPHEYMVDSGQMTDAGIVELEPEDDFIENVTAFDIELVKYKDSGAEDSGLQQPGAGVRFDIVSNSTGKKVATVQTDARGYASTEGGWYGAGERPAGVKGSLPYDAKGYTVREDPATTPEGYRPAPDWQIPADRQADGATLSYIVDNDFVSTHVQVVKTDAATGQTVALKGFRFQLLDASKNPVTQEVWYPNHAEMSEFETDGTGMVTFPQGLKPGTYWIREVAAQAPYLLNGQDVKIEIPNEETLDPVTAVKVADEQAHGRATVVKTCSDDGKPLAGAEFDVVATADVVSPDGSVKAVEGEVVDHVKTGDDGTATTKDLFLGSGEASYAFVETRAPSGHVLDATPHPFTLAWADHSTPIVETRVEVSDAPNRLAVDKDVAGGDAPLEGAEFALWRADEEVPAAADESMNAIVRADRGHELEVAPASDCAIIEADGSADAEWRLVDEDGTELPILEACMWRVDKGVYTLVASRDGEDIAKAEIKAKPSHSYAGHLGGGLLGTDKVDVAEKRIESVPLEWSEDDAAYIGSVPTGRQRIVMDGRSLGEVDMDGRLFAQAGGGKLTELPILLKQGHEPSVMKTDAEGMIRTDHLAAGTWRLKEVSAPKGYLVDSTVRQVEVGEDGLVNGEASHTVEVEDDYTKLDVSKRDITNEQELPGAKLTILDGKGEVVESWESTDKPHRIELIEPGEYTLVEEMTPHRYDKASKVPFTVLPTGEIQSVTMYDEPIEIAASIDKRQEIADPVAKDTDANGDGKNRAETTVSDKGEYDYSIDFRSDSSTWVDEFTVTDDLTASAQGLARLDSITTPVAGDDYDGRLNVWYRTNLTPDDFVDESGANATLSDGHDNPWLADPSNAELLGDDGRRIDYTGWKLWKADVDSTEAQKLEVSELGLEKGEHIVAVRLEYGRVEKGFTSRTGEWDRDDLKDPHDDMDDIPATHEGDALDIKGHAVLTREDGGKLDIALADLAESEDGAGWMIDTDKDGNPEFYAADSVELVEDGKADRAPLILSMHVTDDYRPGTELRNDAGVLAFRNGGGERLEDDDADSVVQTPKSVALPLPQTGIDPRRIGTAIALAAGAAFMVALWAAMRPKTHIVARDVFGDRIR